LLAQVVCREAHAGGRSGMVACADRAGDDGGANMVPQRDHVVTTTICAGQPEVGHRLAASIFDNLDAEFAILEMPVD
jgi:hypothetical protein